MTRSIFAAAAAVTFIASAVVIGWFMPSQMAGCSPPAEAPTANVLGDGNQTWLACPPKNYHTGDEAYSFSTLPTPGSVVGTEKFMVWGLHSKAECVTLGNNLERTDAFVRDGRCWIEQETDNTLCQIAQNDLRIVHTCVDGAGQPVPRDAVTNRLNTKRQAVPGHPGVASRCVVGITDHGCEPKPVAVANNP